jgi:hypothetical protein
VAFTGEAESVKNFIHCVRIARPARLSSDLPRGKLSLAGTRPASTFATPGMNQDD